MRALVSNPKVCLYFFLTNITHVHAPCDMRNGFNGLGGLVRNELERESTNGDVFIFLNRPRTHSMLLHW